MTTNKQINIATYRNDEGLLHKADGPAIIWHTGSKMWYIDGKLHRIGGPAIEYKSTDGLEYNEYYINGRCYNLFFYKIISIFYKK